MKPSLPENARVGLLLVFGLGFGLLVLHVSHALSGGENIRTILLGVVFPLGLALGLIAGGGWLWRQESAGEEIIRVGVWCIIGAIVLAIGAGFTILYEQAEGVVMSDQLFVVSNASTVGAVFGFVVGIYDNRQRRSRAEATQLTHQLTVVNRVLRHDIRTAATVIRGYADLLTSDTADFETEARKIKEEADQLVELGETAKELEQVFRDDDLDLEVVDLASIVETASEQVRRDYPDADITVSIPESQPVETHPLVDSALTELIENAVEHNDKQTPRVSIDAESVSWKGADMVELRIRDNGPGIPETEIEVLDRGYETDLYHLSGIGLWLAKWVTTKSGGEIRFEVNDPEGAVVLLRFPRA